MAGLVNESSLLLTIPQAARLVSISRSHAYQLVQQGAWPVIRLGRSCRVPAGWLEAWVKAQVARWEQAKRKDEDR